MSASNVSKSGKRHIKAVDPDPHGEKLLQVLFSILACLNCVVVSGIHLFGKSCFSRLKTH